MDNEARELSLNVSRNEFLKVGLLFLGSFGIAACGMSQYTEEDFAREVRSTQIARNKHPESSPRLEDLPAALRQNTVRLTTSGTGKTSIGTGLVFAEDRERFYVLTAEHLFRNQKKGLYAEFVKVAQPQFNIPGAVSQDYPFKNDRFRCFPLGGDYDIAVAAFDKGIYPTSLMKIEKVEIA